MHRRSNSIYIYLLFTLTINIIINIIVVLILYKFDLFCENKCEQIFITFSCVLFEHN